MISETVNKAMPFLLIGGVIILLYLMTDPQPRAVVGDTQPIPLKEVTYGTRGPTDDDSTYTVTHKPSGDHITLRLYDDELREKIGERTKLDPISGATVEVWDIAGEKKRYWVSPGFDLGVYCGLLTNTGESSDETKRTHGWDYGIRLSPSRFVDEHLAPDLLASHETIGLGISYFPFPIGSPRYFRHIGMGLGRVLAYRDDSWHTLIYLSTEFRF